MLARAAPRLLLGSVALILSTTSLASGLRIASALNTVEYTPELVAIQDYLQGVSATITNGGVANLFGGGGASIDLAANAETQALRQYATHKDLRIVYTVAQVSYRLAVAKKGSGVTGLADLKGKRIGTFPGTSAAYFVEKLLREVGGLSERDYTVVSGNICNAAPCGQGTLPYMLAHGAVDAVGCWEPTVQLAIDLVGADKVAVFQNRSVYREVFNLHSTASKLADPATRKDIVAFLRALNKAERVFASQPDKVWPRVGKALGMSEDLLKEVWPVHDWSASLNGTLPPDLLDVLTAEDQWVAGQDRRAVVQRTSLQGLIDGSVLAEAMSG